MSKRDRGWAQGKEGGKDHALCSALCFAEEETKAELNNFPEVIKRMSSRTRDRNPGQCGFKAHTFLAIGKYVALGTNNQKYSGNLDTPIPVSPASNCLLGK